MALPERINVAGHRGMVGSAIARKSVALGSRPIVGAMRIFIYRETAVRQFAGQEARLGDLGRCQSWWHLAKKSFPADFIYENLQ